MLADQHHRALKKGTSQLPAVQQQLTFQKLLARRHGPVLVAVRLWPEPNLDQNCAMSKLCRVGCRGARDVGSYRTPLGLSPPAASSGSLITVDQFSIMRH